MVASLSVWHEKSKFYRLLFVSLFLFLIDKAVELFLPPFPGGVKHLLLLLIFFFNWILSGSHLFKSYKNYYLLLLFNFIYLVLLLIISKVFFVNFILGVFFTFLFSFVFVLSVNTKTKVESILSYFKVSLYLFLFFSLFTFIPSLVQNTSVNKSYVGLFRELGALGGVLNISCILSLVLYLESKSNRFLYLAMICTFFIFLTIMKKSILSNGIIWVLFAFIQGNSKKKYVLILLVFFLFTLFALTVRNQLMENISLNVEYFENAGEEHVRLVMYMTAFKIASDNFPFGSGAGTFGSLPSLYNGYSQTYYKYDIDKIEPLSPERVAAGEGHTLFDTYWPHIIGEYGYLGLSLFLLIWFYPLFKSYSFIKLSSLSYVKPFAFYILAIGIVMTFDGFVLYTPEISAFILFHSGLSGLCMFHLNQSRSLINT